MKVTIQPKACVLSIVGLLFISLVRSTTMKTFSVLRVMESENATITDDNWKDWVSFVLNISLPNNTMLQSCSSMEDIGNECTCENEFGTASKEGRWAQHHRTLTQTAENFTGNLDVLFVGDSIIEQWNGTKWAGKGFFQENRRSFQNKFSMAHSSAAKLEGLAFGSAGDKISNLNWHIQNGFLPDSLNPRIIWILIGTNNLINNNGTNCSSAENIVMGTIEVAYQAHLRKPNATIVLQGILPRSDGIGNFTLGEDWIQIQRINDILKSISERIPFFHFYEFPPEKLVLEYPGEINNQFIRDGVHPSSAGYDLIGNEIETEILKILS